MRQIVLIILSTIVTTMFIPAIIGQQQNTPEQKLLTGLKLVWQEKDRCSAAALTTQISYWRTDVNYVSTRQYLNPHTTDMSVRFDEMISYAESFNLRGINRTGGTIDILKRLTVGGFPVLIEVSYFPSGATHREWSSHNRVVVGYDDQLEVLYALDGVLGGGPSQIGRPFSYAEIEDVWRMTGYAYMVIYDPEHEAVVRNILGGHWDDDYNSQWALERAQARLNTPTTDAFDNYNLGAALVARAEYTLAAQAFDVARALNLPTRVTWYRFEIFEAYLQVGRYDDVHLLADRVIADAPGVEEMYYYKARAYINQQRYAEAIAHLEAALRRNSHYIAAADLLAAVLADETNS